jgi:predicted membrane-bound spermidine synthase
MAALQNSHYIGYGHLHFSSIDGRDKNVWLVVIITQMLIKSSNQALVCSGGDGLEKPLQTPVL